MHELGLLTDFSKLPYQPVETLAGKFGDLDLTIADFRYLPTRCKFIAMMPQWDFLNFLADRCRRYPNFRLLMQAEVQDLIEEGGRVVGVNATAPGGPVTIRSALVVGCDGRHSVVRDRAGLEVEELGAPMDVLWFSLSRRPDDTGATGGLFLPGSIFVMLNRGDYWKCVFVIPKGSIAEVHGKGLPAFRADIVGTVPLFAGRVDEIKDWDQVKLLNVAVDRLKRWYRSGLVCIGTPRTPCRRSAASASISRCRTRWRRRTSWRSRCAGARSATMCWRAFSSGGNFPRASPSACRYSCRIV